MSRTDLLTDQVQFSSIEEGERDDSHQSERERERPSSQYKKQVTTRTSCGNKKTKKREEGEEEG